MSCRVLILNFQSSSSSIKNMKLYAFYPGNKDKLKTQIYDPLEEEKKILELWTKEKVFEKVMERHSEENVGKFTILNGPPFLSGSPHSGHVLNALMKDIFVRYAHQKKLQVKSKFGWDCHGIPIEHEVDKKLKIEKPEDFCRIGVTKYNEECRKFVHRHESDWRNNWTRLGILIDLPGAYSTMNKEYMEGVWAVFKKLFDKELIYKATKVLPYSTVCVSHLSHFEADYNWKEVTEICAIVALKITASDVSLLVCTNSPWKLVANLAVCINPHITYVKIRKIDNDNKYIVSKSRLDFVFPSSSDFSVLEEFQGRHIEGLKYESLFDNPTGSLRILLDDSISDKEGTGIVALCPHFDQNEYRICLENGLAPDEVVCPIDSFGRFNQNIAEVAGLTIAEADLVLTKNLQQRGILVYLQNVERKKQHCWRSDVPLIQKITSTWFLKVENLKEKLKENNSQVTWVPSSNKEIIDNHFEKLCDWPIGRDRHWGTPIPIWSSPSGDEIRCIGSIEELLQLTKAKAITDLHREFIDNLLIPSSVPGNPPLKRVPDVFDCWFESATVPLHQQTENNHQVDMFVEGQDQLNGWFLTTSILSAAFFLPAPAKTIVTHGYVLGPDGTKLSKRKYNHNDAIKIAEKYGADLLRMYLISTPLVAGQSMALDESHVRKLKNKIFQPFYKILYDLLPCLGKEGWVAYGITDHGNYDNIFNNWILLRAEEMVQFYKTELEAYRLHLVIPKIIEFLEQYRKWYVPAIRITSKNDEDIFFVFNIIYKTCLVLTPFAPFFSEFMYQIFKPWTIWSWEHFVQNSPITEKSDKLMNSLVELKVTRWQRIVEMIREARRNHIIPICYRITEVIVVHPSENYLDDSEMLNDVLQKLVNVHQVTRTTDRAQFGASLKAKLKVDTSLHGTLIHDELQKINSAIESFEITQVEELIRVGSQDVLEQYVSINDVEISHVFENREHESGTTIICRDDVFIVVKMNKNLEYYEEGTRKDVVSAVQKLRKKANVYSSELATVCYLTEDTCLERAFEKFSEELRKKTNSIIKSITDVCDCNEEEIIKETVDIKGTAVILYLFKDNDSLE